MSLARLRVAGLILALVACAESGTISHVRLQSIYSPQLVRYVARSGSLPVAIYGNPFASAGRQADARIVAGIGNIPALDRVSFSLLPHDQPRPDGQLVLIFNAKGPVREICREASAYTPDAGGATIRIEAAFCIGDRAVASASGRAPAVDTPADPAFRRSLDRLLTALLPRSHSGGGGGGQGNR